METLLAQEQVFLRGFNARQWHPHLHPPLRCPNCIADHTSPATHRCTDCLAGPMLCAGCILAAHKYLPYHRVEKWNGNFFARHTLKDLGHEITLEHLGTPCPNRPQDEQPTPMTVVDISGVHSISLRWCHCLHSRPRLEQLLAARLWPSTVKEPNTLFTFTLLNDLHHHALTSRKSVLDYWKTVCRKTDNAFPENVPVRTCDSCASSIHSISL